jgi:hypothetical protein
MSGKTVAQKMFVKPGFRVAAVNAPKDYAALVGGLPEGAKVVKKLAEGVDLVHLFVKTRADLARELPAALAAVGPKTLFWVSYPKKTSSVATDLSRDAGWEPMTRAGFEGVTLIAIDDTWSAMRFKPAGDIPSRAGKPADAPGKAAGRTAKKKPPVEVPADLAAELASAPGARAIFEALPPSHQREYIAWLDEAKKPETRARRVKGAVERILATAGK